MAKNGQTAPAARETGARHLVPLAPGWNLWRTICLRGTGFPVSLLESFGAKGAVEAADALIACEAAAAHARTAAFEACVAARDNAAGAVRTALNRATRLLVKGRVPDIATGIPALEGPIAACAETAKAAAAARARFDRLAEHAMTQESRAIASIIAEPGFRTAVIWQNRKALHESLLPLAKSADGPRNKRRRRQERLALRYIQRYAARNESIGFFGPVGWGMVTGAGPAFDFRPGPKLISFRFVEFEQWTIRELAKRLSRDPRVLPWLAPRRNPLTRLEGNAVVDAASGRHEISAATARLIAACDGKATANAIAAALAAEPASGFSGERDVFAALADLARRGVVYWDLGLPLGLGPERFFAESLARIGDERIRGAALKSLDGLVAARDAVAEAADPDTLDAAMAALETRFAQASALREWKSPHAVGRGLVYEDCRRDVRLSAGPDFVARLGPPLSLVLASARWFADEATVRAMDAIERLYGDLSAKAGAPAVDFVPLWRRVFDTGVFSDAQLGPVAVELRSRWAKVLPLDSPERRVSLDFAPLAARVAEVFPARDLPLPRMIHHAPDVMIAAESAAAIARGDYRFVLGETHAGYANLQTPVILSLHPNPEEIVSGWDRDMNGRSHFFPTLPEPERRTRFSLSAEAFELAWGKGLPSRPPEKVFAAADLIVRKTESGLMVQNRDGGHSFHILEILGYLLTTWVPNSFYMFAAAPHTPRITVDNFVLTRESWSLPVSGTGFAQEKTEAARFLAARRWARAHGLPRRVFMRFPHEKKPLCIDLESPGFVDLAAHMWRGAYGKHADAAVAVTEMLPDLNECWLVDAQGNRYTGELRLVAVESPPMFSGR